MAPRDAPSDDIFPSDLPSEIQSDELADLEVHRDPYDAVLAWLRSNAGLTLNAEAAAHRA